MGLNRINIKVSCSNMIENIIAVPLKSKIVL